MSVLHFQHHTTKRRQMQVSAISLLFIFILSFSVLFPVSAASSESDYEGTELVLIWNGNLTDSEKKSILADTLSSDISSYIISDSLEDFMLLTFSDASHLPDALSALRNCSSLRAVDPNYNLSLSSFTNDPAANTQWALDNNGSYYRYYNHSTMPVYFSAAPDIDMNVPEAWKLFSELDFTPHEVIVAIADTGVDTTHPELASAIWVNTGEIPGDGIDNDGNGYIDDTSGWDFYNNDATLCHYRTDEISGASVADPSDNDNHGTHIAGIIAAAANNEIGIAGIAAPFPVKIMPLKIHGGQNGNGSVANAIKSIKYATMMGADIYNCSWGSSSFTSSVETLELTIREADLLFIAAAGNEGVDNDVVSMYPSSLKLDNLLSVSFINADGELTSLSNYGASSVDIAAPGTDIYSTIVGGYTTMSGSSMAVPYVSGIAASLFSMKEGMYPAAIKQLILSTLKPLPTLEGSLRYPGIPDFHRAIAGVTDITPDITAPEAELIPMFHKDFLHIKIVADDFEGSGIRTIKYASGKKTLSAFQRGTVGTSAIDSVLYLAKAGTYSIYLSDYAGNETLIHYKLKDDTTAPLVSLSSQVSYSENEYQIAVELTDTESGIHKIYLQSGEKAENDFPGKQSLELSAVNNRLLFRFSNQGTYTLYVSDYRGNVTLTTFRLTPPVISTLFETIPSKLSLRVGETAFLWSGSSDSIVAGLRYESSDTAIAGINDWGGITAYSVGNTVISVTAPDGSNRKCEVSITE